MERQIIFKCISGSRLYGTNRPDSDFDYRGICFPTEDEMFGLQNFEQQEGISGDEDTSIYSLKKFMRLALQNNPNILELLFVPAQSIVISSEEYEILRKNRNRFISKRIFKSHFGYAKAQLARLSHFHPDQMTSKRKDAVEAFGFDTKAAMHLFRLIFQCENLAKTGEMRFPIPEPHLHFLFNVREGLFSLEEIEDLANKEFLRLRSVENESNLPNDPDYDFFNQLCIDLHRAHYTRR